MLAFVVGCAGSSATTSRPTPQADAGINVGPTVASVAPPAKPVPPKPSKCVGLGTDEISEDETPSFGGAALAKKEPVDFYEWIEAHGVKKPAAFAFLASYFGSGITAQDAETYFYGTCRELEVGDKKEAAVVCAQGLPEGLVAGHAVAYVVRNKRLAVVLDVGIHLLALDWPDARWLDLALEFKDGNTVVLRDRAPEGSTLVAPPSECIAQEKRLDQCEKDWPNEKDPESYSQKMGNGEGLRYFQDHCPLERGPDGKLRISRREVQMPMGMYPAHIHDCAGGRPPLVSALKDAPPDQRAEWNRSMRFFDKSCKQRGNYVWKGDRFVKATIKVDVTSESH